MAFSQAATLRHLTAMWTQIGDRHKRMIALAKLVVVASLLASCLAADGDVERGGYTFTTYHLNEQSGQHVGILKFDSSVGGFVCKGDAWAHFGSDWSLETCLLAEPYAMGTEIVAASSWVRPRPERLIVSFATDAACQGYICSGTGGAKGTRTVFYPSGQLKAFSRLRTS